MPSPLILAFEKGYNALPGVMAVGVTSWTDMKDWVRQLKDPEIKGTFKSIAVDTIDIAGGCCEEYGCA